MDRSTKPRNPAWQTEIDRLQRENSSLARSYAASEKMLRERTEQLNQADAEIERLTKQTEYDHKMINLYSAEIERLRAEITNCPCNLWHEGLVADLGRDKCR